MNSLKTESSLGKLWTDVEIAHERYRCGLINHRLQSGNSVAAVMQEFSITKDEVNAAVEAHKVNVMVKAPKASDLCVVEYIHDLYRGVFIGLMVKFGGKPMAARTFNIAESEVDAALKRHEKQMAVPPRFY